MVNFEVVDREDAHDPDHVRNDIVNIIGIEVATAEKLDTRSMLQVEVGSGIEMKAVVDLLVCACKTAILLTGGADFCA